MSILLVLLALAGCGKPVASGPSGDSAATTQPSTPAASAGPTASASVVAFTADGIGPYLLGAKLSDLKAAGVLDNVFTSPEICDFTTADGTGAFKDVKMVFRPEDGMLYNISTRSTTLPALMGARLGSTLAELKAIYGSMGEELKRDDAVGYLVTAPSGNGLVFHFDPQRKANLMVAANASGIKQDFLDPIDRC